MKKKVCYCLFLSVLLVLASFMGAGCAPTEPVEQPSEQPSEQPGSSEPEEVEEAWVPDEEFLVLVGGVAGTWPPLAAKIAEIITREVDGVTAKADPGAAESNVMDVGEKRAELGFAMGYGAYDGYVGKGVYTEAYDNLRHLASLHTGIKQWVVPANSQIFEFEDLLKHRIRTMNGGPGSFTTLYQTTVLDIMGSSFDDIRARGGVVSQGTLGDSNSEMMDGQLDWIVHMGSVPYSLIMELETSMDIRLLEMDDELKAEFRKRLAGFFEYIIPKGTYNCVEEDHVTLATPYMVITRAELSDEYVYRITKAIWDNQAEIQAIAGWAGEIELGNALRATALPVHPGAQRYYDEHSVKPID